MQGFEYMTLGGWPEDRVEVMMRYLTEQLMPVVACSDHGKIRAFLSSRELDVLGREAADSWTYDSEEEVFLNRAHPSIPEYTYTTGDRILRCFRDRLIEAWTT
jgi:hypothetical protein